MIVSTVCIGSHLSDAGSYPYLSSPGSCNIDIHTVPSFSTVKENRITNKPQKNKGNNSVEIGYQNFR